jgi:hypothetical protein
MVAVRLPNAQVELQADQIGAPSQAAQAENRSSAPTHVSRLATVAASPAPHRRGPPGSARRPRQHYGRKFGRARELNCLTQCTTRGRLTSGALVRWRSDRERAPAKRTPSLGGSPSAVAVRRQGAASRPAGVAVRPARSRSGPLRLPRHSRGVSVATAVMTAPRGEIHGASTIGIRTRRPPSSNTCESGDHPNPPWRTLS